jgi:hypothetical protein
MQTVYVYWDLTQRDVTWDLRKIINILRRQGAYETHVDPMEVQGYNDISVGKVNAASFLAFAALEVSQASQHRELL